MNTITKYVLLDIIKVFLVVLLALTLVMLLVGVVEQAARSGLGPLSILQIIPYILPKALVFAIPGTLLLAITAVYGRMSADNEIQAIKSMGISPMRVVWPALAIGFMLSLVTLVLYELGAVWGYYGVQRVAISAIDDVLYGVLQNEGSISTADYQIFVKKVEGRKLIQLELTFHSPEIKLVAKEAEIEYDEKDQSLVIFCQNGSVWTDRGTFTFPKTHKERIPISRFGQAIHDTNNPAHTWLHAIPAEIDKDKLAITRLEQQQATHAALQMMTGNVQELLDPHWSGDKKEIEHHQKRLFRFYTEGPRRWATGFSCLCFACIGIPVAIRRKNSDFISSFFVCFLPILVVYYPFLMFGLEQAKTGRLPAYSVWLANAVIMTWGIWMLRKMLRH